MGIKWRSNNNNLFEELSVNDPNLLSYFGKHLLYYRARFIPGGQTLALIEQGLSLAG